MKFPTFLAAVAAVAAVSPWGNLLEELSKPRVYLLVVTSVLRSLIWWQLPYRWSFLCLLLSPLWALQGSGCGFALTALCRRRFRNLGRSLAEA